MYFCKIFYQIFKGKCFTTSHKGFYDQRKNILQIYKQTPKYEKIFYFKTNIVVFVCCKMLVKPKNISVDRKTLYKIL